MKIFLSYTKVSSFLRCEQAYYFRYIEKIPTPLPGRMLAGLTYHRTLAKAELKLLVARERTTKEEIEDSFATFWEQGKKDRVVFDYDTREEHTEATYLDWGEDKEGELKDDGIKLALKYNKEHLPGLKIKAIEQKYSTILDGNIYFTGYPDLVLDTPPEVDPVLVDHKFSSKVMGRDEVERDLQSSSYAMLLGGPLEFEFHQALNYKKKQIKVTVTSRGEEDIKWLENLIRKVAARIQAGDFIPRPTGWWCSLEGCNYWLRCKHPSL